MAWEIDPSHSEVMFSVRHAMISTVRGHFNVISGHLHIDEQIQLIPRLMLKLLRAASILVMRDAMDICNRQISSMLHSIQQLHSRAATLSM